MGILKSLIKGDFKDDFFFFKLFTILSGAQKKTASFPVLKFLTINLIKNVLRKIFQHLFSNPPAGLAVNAEGSF